MRGCNILYDNSKTFSCTLNPGGVSSELDFLVESGGGKMRRKGRKEEEERSALLLVFTVTE